MWCAQSSLPSSGSASAALTWVNTSDKAFRLARSVCIARQEVRWTLGTSRPRPSPHLQHVTSCYFQDLRVYPGTQTGHGTLKSAASPDKMPKLPRPPEPKVEGSNLSWRTEKKLDCESELPSFGSSRGKTSSSRSRSVISRFSVGSNWFVSSDQSSGSSQSPQ